MAWPDKKGDKNLSIVEPDDEVLDRRRKEQLTLLTGIRDFTLRGEVSQHDIITAISAILKIMIAERSE